MKIKYLVGLFLIYILSACNQESVSIHGNIKTHDNVKVELKLKSVKGETQSILKDTKLDDCEFDTTVESVKPPFKMTLIVDGEKEYDLWVFRYGKFDFEISENGYILSSSSMENTEYDRISQNYYKMYFKQIEEKELWVKENEEMENLSSEDEEKMYQYQKDIKKAYKLRKKSILSTFRKNPQNRIAMALLFDEYERLTTWQKEECLKTAQKYYSDCGINWQLRN